MNFKIASIVSTLLATTSAFAPSSTSFVSKPTTTTTQLKAFFSDDSYTSPRFDEPEPEIDPRRKTPDEKPAAPPVRMPVIDIGDGNKWMSSLDYSKIVSSS